MEVWQVIALVILAYLIGSLRRTRVRIIGVDKQRLYDQQNEQGYYSARVQLPSTGATIEDINLALHRIEGVAGAVNDTLHDLKQEAKKLNGETTDSARE